MNETLNLTCKYEEDDKLTFIIDDDGDLEIQTDEKPYYIKPSDVRQLQKYLNEQFGEYTDET